MDPKNALRELSEKLDPARREFAIRLYRRSSEVIEAQVLDSASLFWSTPNHVLVNLERLLERDPVRRLNFFLDAHSRRHYVARKLLGEDYRGEHSDFERILYQCSQPTAEDMREKGLVGFIGTPVALNRAKIIRALLDIGGDLLRRNNEETDANEPGRRIFRTWVEPWYIETVINLEDSLTQATVECDVRIGMGPLNLERQLSLHGIIGIGSRGCDMAEPGQERLVASLLVEHIRFLVGMLRDILTGVDAKVSIDEVRKIEKEWVEWVSEARKARTARRRKQIPE